MQYDEILWKKAFKKSYYFLNRKYVALDDEMKKTLIKKNARSLWLSRSEIYGFKTMRPYHVAILNRPVANLESAYGHGWTDFSLEMIWKLFEKEKKKQERIRSKNWPSAFAFMFQHNYMLNTERYDLFKE